MKTLQILTGLLLLAGIETANAQYKDLHDFNLTDGADPYGSLLVSGNTLYGVTADGGANWASNDGNIFSLDTNGSSFTDLFDFNGSNGRNPYSTLVLNGSSLYGSTWMGEQNGYGDIFSINTNGSSYTDLHNFNGIAGQGPRASLILSNGVLYGTAESGGAHGYGCVFSMNLDGSGYTDLFDFNDTLGATPKSTLVLSGTTLYGLTSGGGANGDGVVFSILTNGSEYIDLLDFNGENGSNPQSSLILSGTTLYGMTYAGAANGYGNIFSINTDGTGFRDLFDFNGTTGKNPTGRLTFSGNVLYGMTTAGGVGNNGVIFSINTNGTGYTVVYNFDYNSGANPHGSLALSGNMLYGMTSGGGVNGSGVVFSYKIANPVSIGINNVVSLACNGSGTGSITATAATGGISPYTYSWSPSGGHCLTAANLSAGCYTITVTDNSGNVATASATLTQPNILTAAIGDITNAGCNGSTGSATIIATGGAAPYTYLWSPSGRTNATETDLSAGTYSVSVTDNNGCSATSEVSISEPEPLVLTIDSLTNGSECNGMASISVSGGTAPYTYLWSSNGATTATIKNQCAGTYCCLVTDAKGCSKSTCIDINAATGTQDITNTSAPATVYPNPTTGPLTVSGVEKGMTIEMYDALGRKLNDISVDNDKVQLNLSNQANGIYLVRFLSEDGAFAGEKKVIKTN